MQGELVGYAIKFCHWAAGLIKWKGALPIVFGSIVPSVPARPEPQDEEDEEREDGQGFCSHGSPAAWEMMELHLLPWNPRGFWP